MNQTMIFNKGITETIISDNNKIHVNSTNWKANYDGNNANILVDSASNGQHTVYKIQLDNDDLASLLQVPSDTITLDKRLLKDFKKHNKIKNRTPTPYPLTPHTHISSPLPNEDFILSSKRSHKRHSRNYTKYRSHINHNKSQNTYKINRRTRRTRHNKRHTYSRITI